MDNAPTHLFKAFLKGSDEALQQAYRRSIRALAEFYMEYGSESIPGDLDFRWEWIDSYRVFTIITDGSGIIVDFDDIKGIEENLHLFYNTDIDEFHSNDVEHKVIDRKELFGIPEADYELSVINPR